MSGTHLIASNELVLLMGPPGAGKDTHAATLADEAGAVFTSTGQLMREANDPKLNAIMATGGLVPEEDLQRVLTDAIKSLEGHPLILAGATKKPKEAAWLLQMLPEIDRRILVVVYLRLDAETGRQRIAQGGRGRADDDPAVQERRRVEFETETMQSLEIYWQAGLLKTVDATASPERVYERVSDTIRWQRRAADTRPS